jgi:hypothetical protein
VPLLMLTFFIEGDVIRFLPRIGDQGWHTFYALMAINGFLAFFVNLTNLLVTRYTGPLTMQVWLLCRTSWHRVPAALRLVCWGKRAAPSCVCVVDCDSCACPGADGEVCGLQVLGNTKGVLCVFVSIWLFGNPWTYTSMAGYLITITGVALYANEKRREAMLKAASKYSIVGG